MQYEIGMRLMSKNSFGWTPDNLYLYNKRIFATIINVERYNIYLKFDNTMNEMRIAKSMIKNSYEILSPVMEAFYD